MRSLWFKQCFVADILAGRKTDTMRPLSARLPAAGDLVRLCVGPRPPFAEAKIKSVEIIELVSLSAERRGALSRCYRDPPSRLARLVFRVSSSTPSTT